MATEGNVTEGSVTEDNNSAAVLGGDNGSGTPVLGGEGEGTQGDAGGGDAGTQGKGNAVLKYELTVPDGYKLYEERVGEIEAYAKERGLSNEVAQDFLNTEHAAIEKFVETQQAQAEETKTKWVEDLKNDKQFGGAQYNKTVELAKRAFSRFATKALTDELNKTGYGNHPELIKTFARMGELMSDDSLITQQVRVKAADKTIEQILYPDN